MDRPTRDAAAARRRRKRIADEKQAREKAQAEHREAIGRRQADADAGRKRSGCIRRARHRARAGRLAARSRHARLALAPTRTRPSRGEASRQPRQLSDPAGTPHHDRNGCRQAAHSRQGQSVTFVRQGRRRGACRAVVSAGHRRLVAGRRRRQHQLVAERLQHPIGPSTQSAMVEACVSAYAQTVAMLPGDHWRLNDKGGRDRVKTSALSRAAAPPERLSVDQRLHAERDALALPRGQCLCAGAAQRAVRDRRAAPDGPAAVLSAAREQRAKSSTSWAATR